MNFSIKIRFELLNKINIKVIKDILLSSVVNFKSMYKYLTLVQVVIFYKNDN